MTSTALFRTSVGLLATALLLTGLTGCSKDPLDELDEAPRSVSFGDTALWTADDVGLRHTYGVEFRAGSAFVAGLDAKAGGIRLTAADAATGKPRWTVGGDDPLRGTRAGGARLYSSGDTLSGTSVTGFDEHPVVIGSGAGRSVLVQYTAGESDREERGVAALRAQDGTVRWKRPLVRRDQATPLQSLQLLTADRRTVLVGTLDADLTPQDTVALDASGGRRLWKHPGGWAAELTGGLAIGGVDVQGGHEHTSVFAVDARTGRAKWDLAERHEWSSVQAVAGDRIVVGAGARTDPEDSRDASDPLLLDAADGDELAPVPGVSGTSSNCAGDGTALIACLTPKQGTLESVRSGGDKPLKAEDKVKTTARTPVPTLVWKDLIFTAGAGRLDGPAMVDRSGKVHADDLPGAADAVSERFAAFLVPGDDTSGRRTGLAVHAVTVKDD